MYGYPKHINTRSDIEYLVGFLGTKWATDENRSRGTAFLRSLIEGRFAYQFDRVLADEENPDGESPDYIVLTDEDGARRQLKRVEDKNAMIYRLGFTVDEVEALIDEVESN